MYTTSQLQYHGFHKSLINRSLTEIDLIPHIRKKLRENRCTWVTLVSAEIDEFAVSNVCSFPAFFSLV